MKTPQALQRGRAALRYVIAIEGISTILTTTKPAAALAAWAGTDWDPASDFGGSAIGGVFVDIDNKQSANPLEPFQSAGTATVTVLDDAFGILTHRSAGGAESELTLSMNRTDTTIQVADTTAFPTSGELHIGTECIRYAAKNSTNFNAGAITRGMFSPFANGEGGRHTHDHRVDVLGFGPNLQPKVTQYPREWIGRWVGIWMHHWSAGALNSKDDAQLVFAGRIAELRDDETTTGTVIVLEHLLDVIKDSTVARDMWTGTVGDGIYLSAGLQFQMLDNNGSTNRTPDPLVVVPSGASTPYEMNEGFWSLTDLFSALNGWWAQALVDDGVWGQYSINVSTIPPGTDYRTKIYWTIPGSGSVSFQLAMPRRVAVFLGFLEFNAANTSTTASDAIFGDSGGAGSSSHYYNPAGYPPLRNFVAGLGDDTVLAVTENGTLAPQLLAALPTELTQGVPPGSDDYALFVLDESLAIVAKATDGNDGTFTLSRIKLFGFLTGSPTQSFDALHGFSKRFDDATPTTIRQVFVFSEPFWQFWSELLFSTGTAGFNSSARDKLPYGIGLGIPGELLDHVDVTAHAIGGGDKFIQPFIDRPVKVSALLGFDLHVRRAFPVWRNESLELATWKTPTNALAVATLDESNKSEPAGRKATHRTSTLLSARWTKPVIKIKFNRDLLGEDGLGSGDYRATRTIEDHTAIDNLGDRADPYTLEARNVYSEFLSGPGLDDIIENVYVPTVTLFTHPARTLRRSIAMPLWEGYAPGDIVRLEDRFARDPVTGRRVLAGVPALLISHRYNPGGLRAVPAGSLPNRKPEPPVAEVEVYILPQNRVYAYAPSALVASYNAGTKELTLEQHEYSEASEDVDVTRFGASDKVQITEVDPPDPATALTYTRTLTAIAGDVVTHDGAALGAGGGETAFDAGKTYRVTYATYSTVQASQQDKAYQADDADQLIEDLEPAKTFGAATSSIAATESEHTDLGELHAAVSFGDGRAYDVGAVVGVGRLVENLIDHKTATSSPSLGAIAGNTDYPDGYKLVRCEPIYLQTGIITNGVNRFLAVAPWFRSSDGTATTLRITLARTPPQSSTLNDAARDVPYSEAVFATSSTTWSTPDPVFLPVAIKGSDGIAWLLIECAYKCQTRGAAHAHVLERVFV